MSKHLRKKNQSMTEEKKKRTPKQLETDDLGEGPKAQMGKIDFFADDVYHGRMCR